MANTENIEAKLAAYVDDELDAADRAQIEKHLADNPQHRALIKELKQNRESLRALPRVNAPPEVAEMLGAQLERAALLGDVEIGADGSSTSFSRWPQVRAIAAIIVLTIGLAGALYYILPSPKPSPTHVSLVMPEPTPTGPSGPTPEPTPERLAKPDEERELATTAAPSPAGGTAPASVDSLAKKPAAEPANPVYLYVDTANPASANEQVAKYLDGNGISWRVARIRLEDRDAGASSSSSGGQVNGGQVNGGQVSKSIFADLDSTTQPTTSPSQVPESEQIVARMTDAQATQLCAALTHSQDEQSAQLFWPQNDQEKEQAKDEAKAGLADENRANESRMSLRKAAAANAIDDLDRALSPGDALRIRAHEPTMQGVEPVDETVTVDADGFISLPTVGRLAVAGSTPRKLASETIPQAMAQLKQANQSPPMELSWTVERAQMTPAANEKAAAPTTAPTGAPAEALANAPAIAPPNTPANAPATEPTTRASELSLLNAANASDDKSARQMDVVIILRAVPANAATSLPTTEPTEPQPGDLTPGMAPSAPSAAPSAAPTTQSTAPITAPATGPADR